MKPEAGQRAKILTGRSVFRLTIPITSWWTLVEYSNYICAGVGIAAFSLNKFTSPLILLQQSGKYVCHLL